MRVGVRGSVRHGAWEGVCGVCACVCLCVRARTCVRVRACKRVRARLRPACARRGVRVQGPRQAPVPLANSGSARQTPVPPAKLRSFVRGLPEPGLRAAARAVPGPRCVREREEGERRRRERESESEGERERGREKIEKREEREREER